MATRQSAEELAVNGCFSARAVIICMYHFMFHIMYHSSHYMYHMVEQSLYVCTTLYFMYHKYHTIEQLLYVPHHAPHGRAAVICLYHIMYHVVEQPLYVPHYDINDYVPHHVALTDTNTNASTDTNTNTVKATNHTISVVNSCCSTRAASKSSEKEKHNHNSCCKILYLIC